MSLSERVTIVIRTKDRPVMLARALDDVLAQDMADWRIVVVNHGGDPAPVDQLVDARRGLLGDRVDVLHLDGSGTMETAANAGARAGAGEFIALHDDDDTWAPDFLSTTVAHLDRHHQDGAVAVPTEIVRERLDGERLIELEREPFTPPGDMVSIFDLLLVNRVVPIAMLVRRSVYEAVGGYDDSLAAVGDWDFNLRVAVDHGIGYVPGRFLAFWHQRPQSAGAAANSVFGAEQAHFVHDRVVRDRAIREHVRAHGTGGLLYLAKFLDERALGIEDRVVERVTHAVTAALREELDRRDVVAPRERVRRSRLGRLARTLRRR